MARCKTWGQICSQNRAGWDFAPAAEDLDCDHLNAQDVGRRFQSILGSLSGLLDHAAVYAEVRKIDPSILPNARAPGGRGDQACDCRQEGLSGNAGSSVAGLQGLIG